MYVNIELHGIIITKYKLDFLPIKLNMPLGIGDMNSILFKVLHLDHIPGVYKWGKILKCLPENKCFSFFRTDKI